MIKDLAQVSTQSGCSHETIARAIIVQIKKRKSYQAVRMILISNWVVGSVIPACSNIVPK